MIINTLTIDVEEWYEGLPRFDFLYKNNNKNLKSNLEKNIHHILELLEKSNNYATFFVLANIAKTYPELIKQIKAKGHEIATHGYLHVPLYKYKKEEFREDIKKAKYLLEELIQDKVYGYRAPYFSMIKSTFWAYEVLSELGFLYDSSILPTLHIFPVVDFSVYNVKKLPHFIEEQKIIEVPITIIKIGLFNIPIGGGYLRLFPIFFIKYLIKKIKIKNIPIVFHFHPADIDKNIPHIEGLNYIERFIKYYNIATGEEKIKLFLKEFKFLPIKEMIKKLKLNF